MTTHGATWIPTQQIRADALLVPSPTNYPSYPRPQSVGINLLALPVETVNQLLNTEPGTSNSTTPYEGLLGQQNIFLLFPAKDLGTTSDVQDAVNASLVVNEPRKTQPDLAIRQLLQLAELPYNWDGCGAEKPNKDSIREARRFVRALAPRSRVPRPTLHANGDALLFLRDDDGYTEIEFYSNRRFGYYARRGNKEWAGEDIYFDGFELPTGLKEIGLLTRPRYLSPERSAGM